MKIVSKFVVSTSKKNLSHRQESSEKLSYTFWNISTLLFLFVVQGFLDLVWSTLYNSSHHTQTKGSQQLRTIHSVVTCTVRVTDDLYIGVTRSLSSIISPPWFHTFSTSFMIRKELSLKGTQQKNVKSNIIRIGVTPVHYRQMF